jgi:murein DD-endopeptidase MepM/ murein hydrolase activator NlpD
MKTLILVLSVFICTYAYTQQTFQLNTTGTSNIYWPFPNSSYQNPGNWAIRGYNHGQGDHLGGDYYAEDWGLSGNTDCDSIFRSPMSGTVTFAGSGGEPGYGIQVVIRSNNNNLFAFRVCHLSSKNVNVGDNVNAGDIIGRIGTTGSSTACHAHTVLYKNITSIYSGTTTGLQRLQGGLGLGFSGGPNTFAAQYLFSAVQQANVTGAFVANGYVLPSSNPYWKFWKTVNYVLTVTLSNLPSGWGWSLYLAKPDGSLVLVIPAQYGNTYTNSNFIFPNDNTYPNGGNYKLKVTKNGLPNEVLCESPPFYVSSFPILSSFTVSPLPLRIGQSATVRWTVAGGIPGLQYGGWTGDIRIQWYNGSSPLENLVSVPVASDNFTFTMYPVQGITPPTCNIRLAGVNADVGTSMPGGSVIRFTDPFCVDLATNINLIENILPTSFELYQNYPNPFNPETQINFDIPERSFVQISIHNLAGQSIANLYKEAVAPGKYSYNFEGTDLPSGCYFFTLKTRNFISTRKMLLIK